MATKRMHFATLTEFQLGANPPRMQRKRARTTALRLVYGRQSNVTQEVTIRDLPPIAESVEEYTRRRLKLGQALDESDWAAERKAQIFADMFDLQHPKGKRATTQAATTA